MTVVANVSNFVPKPQTPFQWNAMQRREYFRNAHEFLHRRKRLRSVQLKCHDIETSLLEGVMCRGDRRVGAAIELAWRRGRGSTAGPSKFQPRALVAGVGRRRHRRRENAAPPLPCPGRAAVGSDRDSARTGVFGAGVLFGGGRGSGRWIVIVITIA